MHLQLTFGKLKIKDEPMIDMDNILEVKWTREKPEKKGGNRLFIPEDFFVDCCYDLLLALRPYPTLDIQLLPLTEELMELITKCNPRDNREYKKYTKWLKYWSDLAKSEYKNKAFISTYCHL